jgi:hypothetical protein
MTPPNIGLMYVKGFPILAIKRFSDALKDEGLTVHLQERESSGLLAGEMWSMVTNAALMIGGAYFLEMVKQVSKEHYEKLKKLVGELTQTTMDSPRIEPVLFGTPGKVNQDDPFSMAFFIYANLPDSRTAKLLIPKGNENVDYALITNAFLDFVVRCLNRHDNGRHS